MCAYSVIVHQLATEFIDEVMKEGNVEEGRAVPPGIVYIGDEGTSYPGDGTAWIGNIVVDPNA
ncbi:MAG: hypothetical protein H7X83_02555 [Verrucomicrobia bacterium]|nr:hypothetical protein [Deltaproteobacteria bacterium]